MHQLRMMGDDWKSDSDRKREARAIAAREKAAIACAKKLEAAADSLTAFMAACRVCEDGSDDRQQGIADSRTLLIGNMLEYAGWLDAKYNK